MSFALEPIERGTIGIVTFNREHNSSLIGQLVCDRGDAKAQKLEFIVE